MPAKQSPSHNRILDALPAEDRKRLLLNMEQVSLVPGQILHDSGAQGRHVYFPTTAIVSLLHVLEDGASTEVAVVGNEGVVGIALFMGGGAMPNHALVQSAGSAYRISGQHLALEIERSGGRRSGALHQLLLRYSQALITHMAQTAVCNRHHSLDRQLCRWLLLDLDRSPGNELVVTQELIANLLGVRREGVTEAAGRLQRDGLITYHRGHITVLDRARLEQRSCECYAVIKKEYDRLFPQATPA